MIEPTNAISQKQHLLMSVIYNKCANKLVSKLYLSVTNAHHTPCSLTLHVKYYEVFLTYYAE